jgi:hypothetical protein
MTQKLSKGAAWIEKRGRKEGRSGRKGGEWREGGVLVDEILTFLLVMSKEIIKYDLKIAYLYNAKSM